MLKKALFISFFLIVGLNWEMYAQQTKILQLDLKDHPLPFGLSEKIPAALPEISLVLSGGGARGVSQVGVIKAFAENNIPIQNIVGTSIGSILGGLYSSGYSADDLDSIVLAAPWDDFFALEETDRNELFVDQKITEDRAFLAMRLDGLNPILPTSFNSGQKVTNFLNLLTLHAPLHVKDSFDELRYRYRAVCANLLNGKQVILERGSLSLAMRASSSVSFLLAPVEYDSLLLVDGGLVANIPVKIADELGSTFIIATNTTSPLYDREELKYPWNLADQIISIPMKLLNEEQLKYADVVISPDIESYTNNDFSLMSELIDSGYAATMRQIERIRQGIKKKFLQNTNIRTNHYSGIFPADSADVNTIDFIDNYVDKSEITEETILYSLYEFSRTGEYNSLAIKLQTVSDTAKITLIAEQNPIVQNVTVSGHTLLNPVYVDSVFSLHTGKPYNSRALFESILQVLRAYRKLGYSLATLESIEFSKEGHLNLSFSEGIINELVLNGNDKTNDPVIFREIKLHQGKIFNYREAEEGLANLRGTNLFNKIELVSNRTLMGNQVEILVDEKISSLVRFGLRIDNEYLTQLLVDLRDENVFGTGTEIGSVIQFGSRSRSFVLEHKANRVFDSYFNYKLRAFLNFNDINTYINDSTVSDSRFSRSKLSEYRQINSGLSLAIGTQVRKFGNLTIEGRLFEAEVKNKIDYTGDTYKQNVASLRVGLSVDSQNKYPFPTKGFLVKGFYETAQKLLGTDLAFSKLFFDYKSISEIAEDHTLSPRFVAGFADETLPLSEQFSLGGQNTFFGLRDHEFRGRQIFLTSIEYRFKLPVKLFFDAYIKARYDLGSIWSKREELKFKDFKHGIGASFSLDTPIGPADFSLGRSFIIKKVTSENIAAWGPLFFYFTIGYYY